LNYLGKGFFHKKARDKLLSLAWVIYSNKPLYPESFAGGICGVEEPVLGDESRLINLNSPLL
jgi:hypothetical protein